MNTWTWWLYFIYVLEDNLQLNSWIADIVQWLIFLKYSIIVDFKLNFWNVLENKLESV